jgi:hypothetical protein
LKDLVQKRKWEEFRETGLLWWINMILHTFGWALVLEFDDGILVNAYPSRVKYRGFSEDINTEMYKKVNKYMNDNSKELLKDNDE